MIDVIRDEGVIRLKPGNDMTVFSAADLMEALIPVLDEKVDIEIDVEEVREIDSSGVQLLLSLRKRQVEDGKNITLINHSDEVIEILELLGLAHYFSVPVILSASKG